IAASDLRARTVVHTMASLGPDSTKALIQQVTGYDSTTYEAALVVLKTQGLLDPNPHETLHPVVRYSAYQHAPPAWRIQVHRKAAQYLEGELLKQAEHLGRIAAHLETAEVSLLLEAAAIALGTEPHTVLRWLQPIKTTQRNEACELLLARAEILTGRKKSAICRLRTLLVNHPSAEVRIQLANVLRIEGELEEARALLSTGED